MMQAPLIPGGGPSDLPTYVRDPRRMQSLYPGQLLYSAKFDNEKLSCFYLWFCQFCNRDLAASRTLFDVYTNAVVTNAPMICCCCCVRDNAHVLFFDQPQFANSPIPAGCCSPFPYCCTGGCCGCCGEGIVLRGPTCGCPTTSGHIFAAIMCCLCPINSTIGLTLNEGPVVAGILNGSVARFRNAGNKGTEAMMPMLAAPVAMMMAQPMMMMQQQQQFQQQQFQDPQKQQQQY